MKKIKVFEMESAYRSPFTINGYRFGKGEKSCAIVGGIRGNEVQSLYICSQIVRKLKAIEEAGGIREGKSVEVISCLNPYSVNIGERFWAMDGTDINRMFPGYDKGETTQRIAAGIFNHLQGFKYGIHFASYYLRGHFLPHVRMMKTDFADPQPAMDFGLPWVFVKKPMPIDTTTLNYNWQIWNTKAYTVLTSATSGIDVVSARVAVNSVLRFLSRNGIIDYKVSNGDSPTLLKGNDLTTVHAPAGGIIRLIANPGDQVHKGEVIAHVIDPGEGDIIKEMISPTDGIVFFACHGPLVMQRQVIFQIITGMHGGK